MKVIFLTFGTFLMSSITNGQIIVLKSDFMKNIFKHGHQMYFTMMHVLPIEYLKEYSSLNHT